MGYKLGTTTFPLALDVYKRQDYRIAEDLPPQETPEQPEPVQETFSPELLQTEKADCFDDVNPAEVQQFLFATGTSEKAAANPGEMHTTLTSMITAATAQSEKYTAEINATKDSFFTGGELGEMLNQNTMQSQYLEEVKNLRIPQFYIKGEPDLFGSTYEFLEDVYKRQAELRDKMIELKKNLADAEK